jgi:hypothetical protein
MLGHCTAGMIHGASCYSTPTTTTGSLWVIAERHPNTLWLGLYVSVASPATPPGTISVTAGTGATKTLTFDRGGVYTLAAPWGAADSGVQLVEIELEDAPVRSWSLVEIPRTTLGAATDTCVYSRSVAKPRIGIYEGDAIAENTQGGADNILDGCDQAHALSKRRIFSWCSILGQRYISGSMGDLWGDATACRWPSAGRRFYSTSTPHGAGDGFGYRNTEVYIYAKTTPIGVGATFRSIAENTVDKAVQTLTATDLIQCTSATKIQITSADAAISTLQFHAQITAGVDEIGAGEGLIVYSIAAFEDDVP